MKYKLIAIDFDGTLYDSDTPHISEKNRQAIRKFIDLGGKIVIATGRMYPSIRPYAMDLGLEGEIIAYQGASIYDIETSKLINHTPLECRDAEIILQYLEGYEYHCQMYYNDIYYVKEENGYTRDYSKFCSIPVNLTHIPLSIYVTKNSIKPTKIISVLPGDKLKDFYYMTKEKFSGQYGFAISCNKFLEVTNINANKGIALKYLGDKYNIGADEMVAIGDSVNDLSMIKYAGLGIAVENAMDELKQHANYIAGQASEDAVSNIIEMVIDNKL